MGTPLLPVDVLFVIALTPALVIALVVIGCLVGHLRMTHRGQHRPAVDVDVAFWAAARRAQRLTVGTPEPKTPVAANVWLPSATLGEALAYLSEAKARRERDHRDFLALIGGRLA